MEVSVPEQPPIRHCAEDKAPFEQGLQETAAGSHDNEDKIPDGGQKAWVVVVGCCCSMIATFGIMNSLGILQLHLSQTVLAGYSTSSIAWITGVNLFLNLFLAVQIGPLLDRFGTRWILMAGSLILVAALVVMGECFLYWHFMVDYGILAGIGSACVSVTALATPPKWFERRLGLAMGIVSASSCIGGITMPFLLNFTLARLSFAWTARILALVALVLLSFANLCIAGGTRNPKPTKVVNLRWFRKSAFVWTTIGTALFEFVLFNTMAYLPEYATLQGFGDSDGSLTIALVNAGSAIGRVLAGLLADKVGSYNVMLSTIAWSAVVSFGLWVTVAHSVVRLYLMAVIFGLGSGSIISLAGVCFGQLCRREEFGECWGTGYSVCGFVVLISIPSGGLILQNAGGRIYPVIMGSILVAAFVCFAFARYKLLGGRWRLYFKV